MMKRNSAIAGLAVLVGCAAVPRAQTAQPIVVPPARAAASDGVLGHDARTLVARFGPAVQDVVEANARKLQFASSSCILDAYLYAPAKGKEPVVTYVDARHVDGRPADSASCALTLSRRR